MSDRTPWHGLIAGVLARIAQIPEMHVPNCARRPRDASLAYSPNWRPDLTGTLSFEFEFLHAAAARDGNLQR